MESEAETATRLGLARPYALGPNVGKCPGGAEYGHGVSLTTVHARGCCAAWDQARAEAGAAHLDPANQNGGQLTMPHPDVEALTIETETGARPFGVERDLNTPDGTIPDVGPFDGHEIDDTLGTPYYQADADVPCHDTEPEAG